MESSKTRRLKISEIEADQHKAVVFSEEMLSEARLRAAEAGYETRCWFSSNELTKTSYSQYWNDEHVEKSKEVLDISNGDFKRMEEFLDDIGLVGQLQDLIDFLKQNSDRELSGCGIDLAAGTLWAAPQLLENKRVEKVFCVEMSIHRLLKLGPQLLKHYGIPGDKVVLCLGDFNNLQLPEASLDFALLSAALHHADNPEHLLAEVHRVLKPDGVVLVVGETLIPSPLVAYARRLVKKVLSFLPPRLQLRAFGKKLSIGRVFVPKHELYPPDPVLGDHFYFTDEYERLFQSAGFKADRLQDRRAGMQGFVLYKRLGQATEHVR